MAEPESGVAAEGQPETHGNRLTRAFKKIKPGEWVLIGIGVVGLVVYFLWYRGQQASNSADALTPAGGTSNPWSSSNVDPQQLDADIQGLTAAIQAGIATTPGTAIGSSGSSGGAHSSGGSEGATSSSTGSKGAASSSSPVAAPAMAQVAAPASSGSGITQQPNNQAPVQNVTALVHSVNNTPGYTGNVGLPITTSTGVPLSIHRAPPNVTSGAPQSGAAAQTHGSTPVRIPAGVRPA